MLNRIRVKSFDSNKQYCSELLAILLQNSRGIINFIVLYYFKYLFTKLIIFIITIVNRLKLGELGGVDILLQVLNVCFFSICMLIIKVNFDFF